MWGEFPFMLPIHSWEMAIDGFCEVGSYVGWLTRVGDREIVPVNEGKFGKWNIESLCELLFRQMSG